MQIKKVAIIGLGLIGGSLAKAITERTEIRDITAVTTELGAIKEALSDATITRGFTHLNDFVYSADIIFICTPIESSLEIIKELQYKVKCDTLITDVCSTKTQIIDFVDNLDKKISFIGGHPMTGSEKTGYHWGSAHMFENAFYILTPSKSSRKEQLLLLDSLIKKIGGIPVTLTADEHDKITAGVSHVPHIIASALVQLIENGDESKKMHMLAAGGFRDITRIASSNPTLWENIVFSNKIHVANTLRLYIKSLDGVLEDIEDEDREKIYDFFSSAKDFRDSFKDNLKGSIISNYEIVVDVVDRPGIIGQITTLLGDNNVNVKNLAVSNSREFENGCLRISFSDYDSMKKANLLLSDSYKVYEI